MQYSEQPKFNPFSSLVYLIGLIAIVNFLQTTPIFSATVNNPQNVNVTAIVYGPPPTTPAVITSIADGTELSVTPLALSGTCGVGLTVKIFNFTELIGTTTCDGSGNFNLNVTLKLGHNELTALNYDFQDQPGPASTKINVYVVEKQTANPSPPQQTSKTRRYTPANNPQFNQNNSEESEKPVTPSDEEKKKITQTAEFISQSYLATLVFSGLFYITYLLYRLVKRKLRHKNKH